MITGINHITFSVKNLERTFNFYHNILCFKPVAKWSGGCYFLAGNLWVAFILDQETREKELPEYTHTAFHVSPENFEAVSRKIIKAGAVIWKKNSSEGNSLYFLDPDGHKLELHSTDIKTRMEFYKANPREGLEIF